MSNKKVKVIGFSEQLLQALEELQEGRSFSELVREACRQYVKRANDEKKPETAATVVSILLALFLSCSAVFAQDVTPDLRGPIQTETPDAFTPPEPITAPKIYVGPPQNASRIVDLTGSHEVAVVKPKKQKKPKKSKGPKRPFKEAHPRYYKTGAPIRMCMKGGSWLGDKYEHTNFGPFCRFISNAATVAGAMKFSTSNLNIGGKNTNYIQVVPVQ